MNPVLKKDHDSVTVKFPVFRPVLPLRDDHHPALSGTALLDAKGTIVTTDQAWLALARKAGLPLDGVRLPMNYFQMCRHARNSPAASRKTLMGIQAVLKCETSGF